MAGGNGRSMGRIVAFVASIVLTIGLAPGVAQAGSGLQVSSVVHANSGTHVIKGDQTNAIYVPIADGYYHDVRVEGNIAVSDGDTMYALHANAVGAYGNSDVKVEVTGSVSRVCNSKQRFYSVAVDSGTTDCNEAEVLIRGGVTATSSQGGGGNTVIGVHVQPGAYETQPGKANVTVYGDIDVSAVNKSDDSETSARGVNVDNPFGQANIATSNITVNNETKGETIGIRANPNDSKNTTVLVDGTVNVTGTQSNKSAGIMR